MTEPTSHEASAALAELAAGKRAVQAADRRTLPLLLSGWSSLVLLDYVAKDHLQDRRVQAAVSVSCAVGTLLLGALDAGAKPVQPVQVGGSANHRAATRLGAALLGWALTERAVIAGLRRSGVRHPNTLAGFALAAGRPLGYLGLRRMLTDPSSDD